MPSLHRRARAGQSSPAPDQSEHGQADAPASLATAPTADEVARWLGLFIDPGQLVELRALGVTSPGSKQIKKAVSFFYTASADRLAAMARRALAITGRSAGVYFTLNPLSPKLAKAKAAAKDKDVIRRSYILIDFDPIRPDGLADRSATDAEKALALGQAIAAREWLRSLGWPEPIAADSGNGYHLTYRIDVPTNDGGLINRCLKVIAARFATPDVAVDTKVSNPSRICKLYGTMARKGTHSADRPHRVSRVLTVPKAITPVDIDQLRALAALADAPATSAPIPDADRAGRGGTAIPSSDRLARARAYLDKCQPAVAGKRGHDRTFKVACKVGPGFDLEPADFLALIRDEYNPRCVPPWSADELRHKVDDAYRTEQRRGWLLEAPRARGNGRHHDGRDGAAAIPPANGRPLTGQAGDDGPVNEAPDDPHRLGRAVLAEFEKHPDGRALAWYREAFYAWDGSAFRAELDFSPRLVALVKAKVDRDNRLAVQAFKEQAASEALAPTPGRPSRPPFAVKVTRRLAADVAHALASMARIDSRAESPFWIQPRDGDPDPGSVIVARNGLVDLDAPGGPRLRPHTPRFFAPASLPYAFDPDSPAPAEWLKFLDDQWGDDPACVRELQKWFGYVLTNDTQYQKMLLLIGASRSGRSTIKEVMSEMVGRHNVADISATSLADRFGMAPLMGKLLGVLGDMRTADTHDATVMLDRVLRITGEDAVEVNRKNQSILSGVKIFARLVVVSNEVPNIRDTSGAITNRYLILRTRKSFLGREVTNLFKKKLRPELPGILNWAIAGRSMLREDGRFILPESSRGLIDDARNLASPIADFVAEECTLAPDASESVVKMWEKWQEWCKDRGHQPGHIQLFGRNLRTATRFAIDVCQPREGDSRHRAYRGIALNPPSI